MGMFGTWWLVLLQWLRIVSDMTGCGLVWTSTIVGWGGLIWLIGVIDVLTSTVTQLSMYLLHSNFMLLWNVNVQMHHNMGNICQLYIVHCTMYIVHWYRQYHGNKCGLNLGLLVSVEVYIYKDVNLYWICDVNNLVGMWHWICKLIFDIPC